MLIYYLKQLLETKNQMMKLMQNGDFNKVQEQMEIYNRMAEQLQIPIYRRLNDMSQEEIKLLAQKLNEKGMNLDLNDTNLKERIIELSISKKTIEKYNEAKQQTKKTSLSKLREIILKFPQEKLNLGTLDNINRFLTKNIIAADIAEYISRFSMDYLRFKLEEYLKKYPEMSLKEFDEECRKIEELKKLCEKDNLSDYENGKVSSSEAFYIIDYNNVIGGPLDIKEKLIEEYCKFYECEKYEVKSLIPIIKKKIEFILNANKIHKMYSKEELEEIFTLQEINRYFKRVIDEKTNLEKYVLIDENILYFYENMVKDYEQIEKVFEINKEKKYKDRNEFFEEYLNDLKKKIIRGKCLTNGLFSKKFSEQIENNGFKDYLESITTIKKFINEESFSILRRYYDEFLRRNLFEMHEDDRYDIIEIIYSNKISVYEREKWYDILLKSIARDRIKEKIEYINTITKVIKDFISELEKEEIRYEQAKEDINNYSLQEQIVEYPKLEPFEIEDDIETLSGYISESGRKK